jgi:hypothetical protein
VTVARRHFLAAVAAATVALSGCATGHVAVAPSQAPGPDRELAVAAHLDSGSVSPVATTSTVAPVAAGKKAVTTTTAAASTVTSAPSKAPTASGPPPAAASRQLLSFDDLAGDAGPTAPRYADALEVAIDDTGSSVRIAVTLAAPVPARLADGEVMGVGVDVFKGATAESDYQLFADGGASGWFGYLQTGNEVVRYPGTLDVSGSQLIFTCPWSALGDVRRAGIDVFVDWSRRGAVGLASSDRVPNAGTATVTR